MKNAIGILKTKVTKRCTCCTMPYTASISVKVYENTDAAKDAARKEITSKAATPYTCRVCKSILNSK
jgi:hypothetical protein